MFRCVVLQLLISFLCSRLAAGSSNSTACQQVCGGTRVSYPFGFSDGCEIRLNCTGGGSGRITIGKFLVQNVTSEEIFITLPPKCNRSIRDLAGLFGANFSPTWRNALLFENCSEPLNDCSIPNVLLRARIGGNCLGGNYNVSCYSVGSASDIGNFPEFLSYESVRSKANCSSLLSSIMVDIGLSGSAGGGNTSIGLNFKIADLGWWVRGAACQCDPNASCTQVNNFTGYRCNCRDGFTGDGFSRGEGCRKVTAAVPDNGPQSRSFLSSRHGQSKVGILVGGIVVGALLMAAMTTIFYCMKKRSATLKSRSSAKRLISEVAGKCIVPLYAYREIERATNSFSEKQRIGTGAYGTVYVGKLHNGEWVAIKKLRHQDNESSKQLKNEIKLLSSVSHPNLVRLLGCCIENGEQILVYEYMPNGTLAQHIQREKGSILPWTTRLTIAAETADAIAYLHSKVDPPIYHRDIKSSNILLDYNFNSKVADFGLSRYGMTDNSHVSTAPQGTPGYVDPEYHQNFQVSDKSDVYSFGVVLLEIITAMKAVDFTRAHSEVNLAVLGVERIGKGRVDEIIDPFLEPNRDAWTLSSLHRVAELAFRCLAFHRDMRPTMIEVTEELEQIRLSGWAPLDETLQMGSSRFSSCSSLIPGSEDSLITSASRKVGVAPPAAIAEENRECSPVSVQDSWPSHRSSASVSSLLCNVVK